MIACAVCHRPIRWSELINGWTHVGPFLATGEPHDARELYEWPSAAPMQGRATEEPPNPNVPQGRIWLT